MSREGSIVQFIFSFGPLRPAEIFREIRKNMDPIWIDIRLFIGCLIETLNYSILSLVFVASSFRVTEEN